MSEAGVANIKTLAFVLEGKGASSEEFLKQVSGFIKFIMHRHMGRYDEDCFNSCYVKLLESLKYYNAERCNLGTFIYSVVRNEVTRFLYNCKKFSVTNEEEEVEISGEHDFGRVERLLDAEKILKAFVNIKISEPLIKKILRMYSEGKSSVFVRVLQWKMIL